MDPIELAASGANVLGSLFQGVTGLLAGFQQEKQYKAAARQADQEAGVNADVALLSGDETAAKAATQAAANGGGLGGSALGVISQASQRAMFNARTETYRGLTMANADLYDAKVARDNGINSLIGSFIGGAGQAAGGVADAQYRNSILKSRVYQSGDVDSYALQGLY